MPQDISGFGVQLVIIASNTFPAGVPISNFSDDADPFTIGGIKIADSAMTLNGTLGKWSKASPIPMTVTVLPGGIDDEALQTIGDNNRVGKGKISAQDAITAMIVYPDGGTVALTGGIMTDYDPGRSVASAGRQKTKTYSFMFESKA